MTDREAIKMALEKCEWGFMEDAANILRLTLAQPEPRNDAAWHWHDLYKAKCQEFHDKQTILGTEIAALEEELEELKEEQLAKPEQDWSLLKATQGSLCEHQARIKELEAQIVQYVSLTSEGKTLQEPVAWMLPDYGDVLSASEADGTGIYNVPLYTAPPKREWVGLTDKERNEMINKIQHDQFTRQRDLIGSTQIITEMYLKERNGG